MDADQPRNGVLIPCRSTGTHRRFIARLQEPFVEVRRVASVIEENWTLVGDIETVAIEVSLDIFPRDSSDEKRWLMTTLLARAYMPPIKLMALGLDQMRCITTGPRGESVTSIMVQGGAGSGRGGLAPDPANHHPPAADGTTCFGAKEGPMMISIQDKISDHRTGPHATALAQQDKRTRVEVRLSGDQVEWLGLHKLCQRESADCPTRFARLRREVFDFRQPTFEPGGPRDGDRRAIFSRTGIYGLERHERLGRSVPRNRKGTMVAFSDFNDRMLQSLQRLDRRWSRC